MIQLGEGSQVGLGLSGATPGYVDKLAFRRLSFTALHAEPLTHGQTSGSSRQFLPMRQKTLTDVIALCFLAGEPHPAQVLARCQEMLGRDCRFLRPVIRRFAEATAGKTRFRHRETAEWLGRDQHFQSSLTRLSGSLAVKHWAGEGQRMQPVPAAAQWAVPKIESLGALAEWLWLESGETDWFADLHGTNGAEWESRLQHYRYKVVEKRAGGIRLIECPKPRLKLLQRQILDYILSAIPAHPAAHGFVRGRSIRSFAIPHTAKAVVLRMDLRNFFPAIRRARVQSVFRMAGYPERVADALGGICTNSAPRGVWGKLGVGRSRDDLEDAVMLYGRWHLPQGAPTSPALANLCAYRADCRLRGLAKAFGADYTRYADDLVFSGAGPMKDLSFYAAAILAEEGFVVHHGKTRFMRSGARQYVAGMVVNRFPNIAREEFDRLKATLNNCVRFGAASQNRNRENDFRAHLLGRVAFVESVNRQRGLRLRAIFQKISWP